MGKKILISVMDFTIEGVLYNSFSSNKIWGSLPFGGSVHLWGNEIYFPIDLVLKEDSTAQDVVTLGTIGYWPPGKAVCLFFGTTPMSQGNECRAASPVNIIGELQEDLSILTKVVSGASITVIKHP